jgi:hypothetical protein
MSHGATFNWGAIRKELDTSDWEQDFDNPGYETRRVFLGSIFSLTPSGKFYLPFACSNVAGDCPVCGGHGSREPRTGRRIRRRAIRRGRDFSKGTVKRGCMGTPTARAYVARVQHFRHAAHRVSNTMCIACRGLGSISAARDEAWNEKLERDAKEIGAFVDYSDGDIFITESRDAEDTEENDDDAADVAKEA